MEIREAHLLYRHPDAEGIVIYEPESRTLKTVDEDSGIEVYIEVDPAGLLKIAEAMTRIAREMLYGSDKK
ncbi:hypothetical protein ACM5Q9_09735 [Advenella sp. RU8]|uniref:hypothetical protein n=1 Tax=Advenella sp. RU8 TaxID=3399575 RepID=UPI003AAD0701